MKCIRGQLCSSYSLSKDCRKMFHNWIDGLLFMRRCAVENAENRNFRLMGPDETASNRLSHVFEATDRVWMEKIEPYDVHLARGKVA